MGWSDKSVSPAVMTPAAADASSMTLDSGVLCLDGRLRAIANAPRASLIYELKFCSSSIVVTGSGVSQWKDTSGGGVGDVFQVTDANRPSLTTDGVDFDTAAKGLVGMCLATYNVTDATAVFALSRIGTHAGTNAFLWLRAPSSNYGYINSSNQLCNAWGNNIIAVTPGSRVILFIEFRDSSPRATYSMNMDTGVETSSSSAAYGHDVFSLGTQFYIGNTVGLGQSLRGALRGFWLYNRQLTSGERALWRNYI